MFLHEILDGIEWISQIGRRCNGQLLLYPWQLILHIPIVLIHQECVFQIISPNSGRLREGFISKNHQKILSRGCFIYLHKKLPTFFFKYQYSEAVSVNLDFVCLLTYFPWTSLALAWSSLFIKCLDSLNTWAASWTSWTFSLWLLMSCSRS